MNMLDLLIVVGMVAAAAGGWRLGLVARAASWAGLVIGLYVSLRVLPELMQSLQDREPTSRLLVAGAVLVGGSLLGQGLGLLIGGRVRAVIAPGPFRSMDRGLGATVGAIGVLFSIWLLLPSMAVVPGTAAQQARNSLIGRTIDAFAPPAPNAVTAIRRLMGQDAFPHVFESLRPAPDTGPPPANVPLRREVIDRVAASTVKVEGVACRRLQQGSGFAVGADTIVTNAHVVAGEDRTEVIRPDRRRLRASVVAFDSERDLAVLRVPGLGQQPLPIASARAGQDGAVFGHPEGQAELRVAPASIRQRVNALGRDLYDSHDTRRDVFILAASLRQGDSGGPLVAVDGSVVGVAFAIAPDRPDTSYALTTEELRAVLRPGAAPAGTGQCLRAA